VGKKKKKGLGPRASGLGPKKKKPAKAKPTARKAKPAARKAGAAPARQRSLPEARGPKSEALGEVTVPTGKLAIFDVGLVGYLPREALEPALVMAEVPRDRVLAVVGQRVGKGRFADCWDHVAVRLGTGEITHSKKLGEAGVDFARLVCMDHGALDHWQHEDSLDGRADFVFWGRDAAALAKAMGAPRAREGYGWKNLPVAEAEARGLAAETLKAKHRWLLATDYRPHSHHFHALAAARKSKHGAGTIAVGGAKVCLFFTSWGDGVFPIYLDFDPDDRPLQIRVQLQTADSNAAMIAVND
jgi:hypothetical protein